MPVLTTAPMIGGGSRLVDGEVAASATSSYVVDGVLVQPVPQRGVVRQGQFFAASGQGPFEIPATVEGVGMNIVLRLVDDSTPALKRVQISRVVTVPDTPSVAWAELIDVVPPTTGDYVVPPWAEGVLEARTEATAAAVTAEAAKQSTQSDRVAAEQARDAALAVGATTAEQIAAQVADPQSVARAALDASFGSVVLATAFGAKGDGVTDDTAALVAALEATRGQALFLPAGEYRVTSATRLLLTGNFSSIVGDPSGLGTIIRFTNAAGGLDIGNGTDMVYENRLVNVLISGNGATTTLVRCRKVYEPYFENVRVENASSAAGSTLVLLHDSGQFDADRIVLANAPIGIRTTGTIDPITNVRLANFYNLTECVRFESSSCAKFVISDSWVEACAGLFTVNRPGAAFSVGEMRAVRVRVLKVTGPQRLFRVIAASSINGQVIDFDSIYVDAPASTSALFDFTTAPTASTVRISARRCIVLSSMTGTMLQVHADQVWPQMVADFSDIQGVSADKLYPSPLLLSQPVPPKLSGVGAPTMPAPRGAVYQRLDTYPGYFPPFYAKQTDGDGTWHAVGTQRVVATKTANYTLTLADEVIVSNGSDLTMTLPDAALWHGRFWTVKNVHTSPVTVASGGGRKIDGVSTKSLAQWASATFVSDGDNWLTLG